MLNQAEKAYILALKSVAAQRYESAVVYFEQAADSFRDNVEFNLIREATRLLVAVKLELAGGEKADLAEIETITSGILADAAE